MRLQWRIVLVIHQECETFTRFLSKTYLTWKMFWFGKYSRNLHQWTEINLYKLKMGLSQIHLISIDLMALILLILKKKRFLAFDWKELKLRICNEFWREKLLKSPLLKRFRIWPFIPKNGQYSIQKTRVHFHFGNLQSNENCFCSQKNCRSKWNSL